MRKALMLMALLFLSIWMLISFVNPISFMTEPDNEFRIGLIAPITGALKLSGQGLLHGAELAVEEVNANGGLLVGDSRVRIHLLIEDNQSSAELSVDAAQRLVDQGVVAVVGPAASANAIPTAERLNQTYTLMIAPISSNPETTRNKRYVFRIIATDDFQARVLAEFAFEDLQTREAAILYTQNDVYSSFLAEVFGTTYRELGGSIVASEPFETEKGALTAQLERIKAQDPEVLVLPNLAHHILDHVHQVRTAGLTIPLLGADSWSSIPMAELDHDFDNTFFSTAWSPTMQSEHAQAFRTAFAQKYNAQPTAVEALTYDAFNLLFSAAQREGNFTTQALLKGISVMESFEGVSGKATYLGQGDPIRDMGIIAIRNGEHHFVKTVEP